MDILFKRSGCVKQSNDFKSLVQKCGNKRARLVRLRLDQLRAAVCLSDIPYIPPVRCHELSGNREGQLSVDLDHPYRLIFEPAYDPIPIKQDSGLDKTRIPRIKIIEIEDTHD